MIIKIKPELFKSRWNSRADAPHVYMCALLLHDLHSLISNQTF